jgi:hypothetical protein
MRRLLSWAAASALLVVASAAPVTATGTVTATSTVSLSHDAGFEGFYKYRITVTWDLTRNELGHLDLFLDLATFADTCNGAAVVFPVPAGTSTGEDPFGAACEVTYGGGFLCKMDPSLKLPSMGATVKFEPLELGCSTGTSGSGTFTFYTRVPPAQAALHPNAVALKHGTQVDFGDLFGSIPLSPGQRPAEAPVVINEFLVLPHGEDHEFVELFDRSGLGVNLAGWSIEIFPRDSAWVNYLNFQPGDSLTPGGFQTRFDTTFTHTCVYCSPTGPLETYLRDPNGDVVDRVGYGNAGGAPISCPLIVLEGTSRPPGFDSALAPFDTSSAPPGQTTGDLVTLAGPETLSTSTNRVPDGNDTDDDAADFNIGSPTPEAANVAAMADLGSSTRVNAAYVYDPAAQALQFYNRTGQIRDIRGTYISDGYFIQPLFPPGDQAPLEPAQSYDVLMDVNGTADVLFTEDARMDLYESRTEGLVRVDQMGWVTTPTYFPDECFVRSPDGAGPADGWDWNTSGGFVTLFYISNCGLSAPNVAAEGPGAATTALAPPWPNPARGAARFEFAVGPEHGRGAPAQVAVYDVAGRRVGVVGVGTYPPGRHSVSWGGTAANGRPVASGVYFARLFVAGRPVGTVRTVVWLRD